MKIVVVIQRFLVASLFVLLLSACDADPPSAAEFAEGVWEDPATGLIWQRNPPSQFVSWAAAMTYCETAQLGGYDDWRLPTISELRSIIVDCPGTATGGDCWISDDCPASDCSSDDCYSCIYGNGPVEGCFSVAELLKPCEHYWSSTLLSNNVNRAWAVGFSSAFIYKPRVVYSFHARCVR